MFHSRIFTRSRRGKTPGNQIDTEVAKTGQHLGEHHHSSSATLEFKVSPIRPAALARLPPGR
ncbi:MAG TPA: hypothetical protein VKG25_13735, partial [Bryobacteraceae bacterium]|nr:hypothetical protein [Bryobacteraceae bacterium]